MHSSSYICKEAWILSKCFMLYFCVMTYARKNEFYLIDSTYFASNSVFDRRSDNPSKTRNIKSACRDMEVQKSNVQISLSLNSQNHLSFPLSAMMSLQKKTGLFNLYFFYLLLTKGVLLTSDPV